LSSVNQNDYGNITLLALIVFHCPFCSEHHLGHGKKIHCFSGKTFPTLEPGSQFFFN